ncbi:hypothetical protein GEV33_001288 [Tenebrio molitor]|uniref:Uncharacterized protein n=1 Tax=Tenebrio molitor TaxID=7067 RepID=A0A8J6HWP3_TENMO|nr:hypothetical protein GEV33_001288 [Tenebrio molitor]
MLHKILLLLVSVLLLLTACMCTSPTDNVTTITLTCMNETGTTAEILRDYQSTDENPKEEVLCFIKCTFEKLGFIKEDGSICIETMQKEEFPEGIKEIKEETYECLKEIPKVTSCEDAIALEKCFDDES